MPKLSSLIHSTTSTIEDIGAHLDGLTHSSRMAELATTSRDDQRTLWEKASGEAGRITLEHFLPAGVPPLRPVVHHGRNTLPFPNKQKFFRKPMVRPNDGTPRAFGYNDAPSEQLVGPGYFVLVSTEGNTKWAPRGAWVVDYFQHPDGAVPPQWPRVRPNSEGLQRLVYMGTRDFMRRVSQHVSIGAAYKGEKPLDHYFTLCRED
ncbi:MAG: hypothetical protein KC593_17635 [Myxococcales bacterium]|nr:hypothetical protein [Myxococcales bacterium]MCB9627925.1 hypothetical protein [Sandaracinaceae bacterium]